VLRRHPDQPERDAPARLQAGLTAGAPDGEIALAWTVAQDLMDLYQLDDPIRPRSGPPACRAADQRPAKVADPRTGPAGTDSARLESALPLPGMSPALVFLPQRLLGYFLGGNTTNFFVSAADGTVFPDVPNNMSVDAKSQTSDAIQAAPPVPH
jgi:hypothetical protein